MQPLSRQCCYLLAVQDRDGLILELVSRRLNATTFSAVLLLTCSVGQGWADSGISRQAPECAFKKVVAQPLSRRCCCLQCMTGIG